MALGIHLPALYDAAAADTVVLRSCYMILLERLKLLEKYPC